MCENTISDELFKKCEKKSIKNLEELQINIFSKDKIKDVLKQKKDDKLVETHFPIFWKKNIKRVDRYENDNFKKKVIQAKRGKYTGYVQERKGIIRR